MPAAVPHGAVVEGQMAKERQGHAQGVRRYLLGAVVGDVGDPHPALPGGPDVDDVVPDPVDEFVPGAHYAHQLPVRWDDTVPTHVEEGGWRKTLIEIKPPEKYEELRTAPPMDGARQPEVQGIE